MNQDLSIVSLILHASFAVQLVIAGLLLVSLASWSVIFGKLIGLGQIKRRNDAFEAEFWSGKNLNDLYQSVGNRADAAPLERIFASGMREFLKLREKRVTDSGAPARRRPPRHARQLPARAGCDGAQPVLPRFGRFGLALCGLFGTIWGIMHAFVGLSNLTQVTLATVAPGIAEALVATAIGLFAAIPAVLAYNRFARQIDRSAITLETFIEEFSNILQRNATQH